MNNKQIWECKIGSAENIPPGSDFPMREAVREAYKKITGKYPDFLFSGWGAKLSEDEKACIRESF